jgi:hypothetical protein
MAHFCGSIILLAKEIVYLPFKDAAILLIKETVGFFEQKHTPSK